MLLGIEAVTRATSENTKLLTKIEHAASAESDARQELTQIVTALRTLLETKNGVSQSMFTALHQELKGYKDGFLLQTMHRPIIRDLISLYDDLAEIHRQMARRSRSRKRRPANVANAGHRSSARSTSRCNVAHNVEFIMEVLARLEVTILPNSIGRARQAHPTRHRHRARRERRGGHGDRPIAKTRLFME